MYEIVKKTIIGWWISILVSLMLWYRGKNYDRVLGIVILIYGLISLFNYGVYNNANPKEVGVSIAVAISISAFLPLLSFLTLKSCSTITGLFLLIIVAVILLAIFYALEYSSEYDVTNNRIVYKNYNGENNLIGISWIIILFFIALIGFLLLFVYIDNTQDDLLRLFLLIISILILLYLGYNPYLISKLYYIIIIIIALALLI